MILQALTDYYDRLASDPYSGIAPMGWEYKEIPFVIVLRKDGTLVNLEDTREKPEGSKFKVAHRYLAPKSEKRTHTKAQILWDNVEYITGHDCKGHPDQTEEYHKAFMQRLEEFADCPSITPIITFLKRPSFVEELSQFPAWKEAVDGCAFMTFRILGESDPVFCAPEVQKRIDALTAKAPSENASQGLCLVTGERDVIARLHPVIQGVRGANGTGGNLVSFQEAAFRSYGNKQGDIAQIGEKAAFKYTTALNRLLGRDSKQKMVVGDTTIVAWADGECSLENEFASAFDEPSKDNPDALVNSVNELLTSVEKGVFTHNEDNMRFFVLGLAPNAARLAVRFWHHGTVAEMEMRFAKWFKDLQIDHAPYEKEHLSLWRLMLSLTPQGKTENIPPKLAGDIMRSVITGTPYPTAMLSYALMRNKAEQDVTYPRAKLIKAYLTQNKKKELKMGLDKTNTNPGYALGRLFATLEKLQSEAINNPNATIRDRFYGAASTTPVTVFPRLINLAMHHLSKANRGVFFDRLITEILDVADFREGFPATFSNDDQSMFALGYFLQRGAFFKGKDATQDKASN